MTARTLLLLLMLAAASPEVRYFEYERAVVNKNSGGTNSGGSQSCLTVDAGVFAHAAPHLADLRLYGDGTKETPYVIRVAATEASSPAALPLLNLGTHGGQIAFDAEVPAETASAHYSDLQLGITGEDFLATVSVSGSQAAGGEAQTKLGDYMVFDLSRQKLGRSTVLHLPESSFPYLHFEINGPLKPENVTGLSIDRMQASQPKYLQVAATAQVRQNGHASVFTFTLPANVPVDRVVVAAGAVPVNFSRNVDIDAAPVAASSKDDGAGAAEHIASANLLRIHSTQSGRRIDEERLVIDTPQTSFRAPTQVTVTIANGDDAPLTIQSVRLEMLERTLCFDAAADASYTLLYGDAALSAPSYDYATLFHESAGVASGTFGPEQANPAYQARPDRRPFTERHPALLWVALILVIAILGGIALRSAKPSEPTKT